MRRAAPSVACLIMLGAMAVQCSRRPTLETTDPYHLAIARAALSVPYAIDGWIGTDAPIIPAATALLRPNVILSRAYRHPETGRHAKVLFVQCRDTRDMAGHAPPRCYPANGYTLEGRSPMTLQVGGLTIPGTEYRFGITTFNRSNQLIVYNFMIRPGGGIVPDESEVRELAAQSSHRYLGAAQVQIALELDRTLARDTTARHDIYVSLLKGYRNIIEQVQRIEKTKTTPSMQATDTADKTDTTDTQNKPAWKISTGSQKPARSHDQASGQHASIRSELL